MKFTLMRVLDSLAGVLKKGYPEYPVYIEPGIQETELPWDSFTVCTPVDAALLADHLARDKDHFYQNDEMIEETQWLEQLRKMTQEP